MCNKSTEPPLPTNKFDLPKKLSTGELYARYNTLQKEYRELRTMYANAADAYESVEKFSELALQDRDDFKDALYELRAKNARIRKPAPRRVYK